MRLTLPLVCTLALGALLVAFAGPDEETPRPVGSKIGFELSGAAKVSGGFLLADDELVGGVGFVRDLETPRLTLVKLYRQDTSGNRLLALEDFEDLAVHGETVYLLGSHHGKQRKKRWVRRKEREFLVRAAWDAEDEKLRLPVKAEKKGKKKKGGKRKGPADAARLADVYTSLIDDLERQETIPTEGLNAEGLAVTQGRLYLGLRAPLAQKGRAYLLWADPDDLFDEEPEPAFEHATLDLQGAGIRALFWDEANARLLVASGPPLDDPQAVCALWSYEPREGALKRLRSFPLGFGTPEAICRADEAHLLIGFDDDGASARVLRWRWPR